MKITRSKAFGELGHIVDIQLPELDIRIPADLGGEARLGEVARIGVDSHDPPRPPSLHLQGVEAGVAADVEHARTV